MTAFMHLGNSENVRVLLGKKKKKWNHLGISYSVPSPNPRLEDFRTVYIVGAEVMQG